MSVKESEIGAWHKHHYYIIYTLLSCVQKFFYTDYFFVELHVQRRIDVIGPFTTEVLTVRQRALVYVTTSAL